MLGTDINYPADHKAMKIVNKAPKPAQTVIEEEEEEEGDDSSDSESVAEIELVFFTSRVNLMNWIRLKFLYTKWNNCVKDLVL